MALVDVSSCRPGSIGATGHRFFGRYQCTTASTKGIAVTMMMARTGCGSGELPTRSNREARMAVVARSSSNGSGGDSASGGEDLLSGKEFFKSFLRRRQAVDGDFVSKAADALREKEVVELDEESRQRVREKLSQLQKLKEVEDTGSILKLSQARSWSLGQDATPTNANSAALDKERIREDRRKQSLLEYEALKQELSSVTVKVAVAASAYCLLVLSPEAMVSYGIGAIARDMTVQKSYDKLMNVVVKHGMNITASSGKNAKVCFLAYLQLLYRHVDDVSEDNVAQIFVQRRPKRIGITSADLQESLEKTIRGSSRALSSPRLVIPSALFGLWGLTERFIENSPFHLQVAPLLFGFFAYKAAALVQTYQDNKDILFMLDDPKGPEDT